MENYRIYADATADIPKELLTRYKISTLAIPVTIGEQSFLSGVEITNEEFYRMMENYDGIPVTSQITPYEFEQLYQKEWKAGTKNLILFLLNSKGSATYGNAVTMCETFYHDQPEAKEQMHIHLIDGASYSVGYGYLAVLAAQKLEMGVSVKETMNLIGDMLPRQCMYFGMYTLKYAGKSGRIPSAAVFVGEALGIKPIMKIWDHQITTAGKARGEKKLAKEIVKMTVSDMEPDTPYCLLYGNDSEARNELCEEATKKIGYPPLYQFQVGAAVAINAGPRLVGLSFEAKGKRRSAKA